MDLGILLALLTFFVAVGWFFWSLFFTKEVVYEYQKGLLYKGGRFVKALDAGVYRYLRGRASISIIDVRKQLVTLPGQEILTKDNVSIKISLVGFYEVSDPVKACHQSSDYLSEFYSIAQIVIRNIVSSVTIDELLERKSNIDASLLEGVSGRGADIGLTVSGLSVKDIMLPSNLKKAFSGVLEAQKEAQRLLEKARGEQAVLRNLANSAGLYEGNPMLLQARLIQALSTGNNSIVFGVDENPALRAVQKA